MPKKQPRQKSPQRKSKGQAVKARATRKAKAAEAGALEIKALNGKSAEPLDDLIAKSDTHWHLKYQAVVAAQRNLRQGTVKTKTRGEVSGGGKKPWRQKGTGRPGPGSTRSPIWVGGGTTHGPKPHSHRVELPRRMKIEALVAGIKDKAAEGKFYMIDELVAKNGKTKEVAAVFAKSDFRNYIVISDACDDLLLRASRNIPNMKLKTSDDVASYDVLSNEACVVTKKGYARLLERIKEGRS